jgi:acyl carrier protein
MSTTEKRVNRIIFDHLGIFIFGITSPMDIQKKHSLTDDLQADSLDAVELIMSMEEEFGTEIPDDVAEGFETVGDVVRYFEAKA